MVAGGSEGLHNKGKKEKNEKMLLEWRMISYKINMEKKEENKFNVEEIIFSVFTKIVL